MAGAERLRCCRDEDTAQKQLESPDRCHGDKQTTDPRADDGAEAHRRNYPLDASA